MLTLEEAIKHCLEVAENNEQLADSKWVGAEGEANKQDCLECAKDHRQLAEWLTNYKEAIRLLKLAVEAVPNLTDRWRYADEALALIGGAENED